MLGSYLSILVVAKMAAPSPELRFPTALGLPFFIPGS